MRDEAAIEASEFLQLWEHVGTLRSAQREDVLLSAQCETVPQSLGERNAELLALRARLFGNALPLQCSCVTCQAVAEFAVDCAALAGALRSADDAATTQQLSVDGYCIEFRVPVMADLRRAAGSAADVDEFVANLLDSCVVARRRDDGLACPPWALSSIATEALSRRMEELEPGASVGFDVTCPDCGAQWNARMDVAEVLWLELNGRAERLLLDVDALARAYGWTEPQILALSAPRRAAYLDLVGIG